MLGIMLCAATLLRVARPTAGKGHPCSPVVAHTKGVRSVGNASAPAVSGHPLRAIRRVAGTNGCFGFAPIPAAVRETAEPPLFRRNVSVAAFPTSRHGNGRAPSPGTRPLPANRDQSPEKPRLVQVLVQLPGQLS